MPLSYQRRSNTWKETWTIRQLKVIAEKESSLFFQERTHGQSDGLKQSQKKNLALFFKNGHTENRTVLKKDG